VEAAHVPWRPLGELFVERGLISELDLEEALAEQASTKERLGEILVRRNLISSPELTEALMEQLGREVAKEKGFGSGLWTEIQRRNSRQSDEIRPSLVEEERSPFGPALGEALGAPHEDRLEEFGDAVELEQDFEELRSELGIDMSPPAPERAHESAIAVELEALKHDLEDRNLTVETLAKELEQVRSSLAAREQTFAEEIEGWQRARREADELRASLSEREARLTELRAEVASLVQARDQEDTSGPSTHAVQAEAELADARRELDVHAAREHELGTALVEREHRIEELQSALADAGEERDASKQKLAEAEVRREQVELELADAQAVSASELERRLKAEGRVLELEGQVAALRAQIATADATLADERRAHAQTQQLAEETCSEAARHREEVREIERGLDALRSERDSARSELEQTRATLAEVEGQIAARQEQIDGANGALIDERNAHAQTRQRSEDAVAEAVALRDASRAVESELEAARSELDAARAELDQASAVAEELEHTRAGLDEARAAALGLEERLATATGRTVELDREVAVLEEKLAAVESALSNECDAHTSSRQQCDEARSRLEEANGRQAELVGQIEGLARERAELLAASSAEREAAARRRAEFEARLAEEAASHSETRRVLAQAIDELTGLRTGRGRPDAGAVHGDVEYLCFAPGPEGYRLLTSSGPLPAAGDSYDFDGTEHVVNRVGRSPLPFDSRRCVYLQAAS
jgi:chromosome segregation ATPase